jgi:hypothetical protein
MGPFSSVSFSHVLQLVRNVACFGNILSRELLSTLWTIRHAVNTISHLIDIIRGPINFCDRVCGVGCGVFFRFRKSVGQSFCFILEDQEGRDTFAGITVLNNRPVDSIAVRHSGVCQIYNYRAFRLNPFDFCAL